jgi:hypothetical protein
MDEPHQGMPMLIATVDLASPVADRFVQAMADAEGRPSPFQHWLLQAVLPERTAHAMAGLPLPVPGGLVFDGKRDTNNSSRFYFTEATARTLPEIRPVMEAFQDPSAVGMIEDRCKVALGGSSLRIEYATDIDGFWLKPHTDLGVKLFTMLIYLSSGSGQDDLGTDLYHADLSHAGRAPAPFGSALVFIPSVDTWHGFEPRPINGVRRSLIVNYVTPEWRARHELAFPHRPIA